MIKEILALTIQPTLADPHHRFNFWKHCYHFFKENHARLNEEAVQDIAALHLGFYLGSWGMMRGSTDLLQKDYKIHLKFVKEIGGNPKYHGYYSSDNQSLLNEDLIDPLFALIESTRECYREFDSGKKDKKGKMEISDTLVTKILLGVFANIPAYDRLFVDGLKLHGINGRLNRTSLSEIIQFYKLNREAFTADGLSNQYTP